MEARRTALVPFLAAAFALMWVCFGAIATGRAAAASPAGRLLILLGVFAPALAAALGAIWAVWHAESVDRQSPRAPRGATEHLP